MQEIELTSPRTPRPAWPAGCDTAERCERGMACRHGDTVVIHTRGGADRVQLRGLGAMANVIELSVQRNQSLIARLCIAREGCDAQKLKRNDAAPGRCVHLLQRRELMLSGPLSSCLPPHCSQLAHSLCRRRPLLLLVRVILGRTY